MRAIRKIIDVFRRRIYTPTTLCTLAGVGCYLAGLVIPAAVMWTVVGVGGVALAVGFGIIRDRQDWNLPTVMEELAEILDGREPTSMLGLLTHIPQAVAGFYLLLAR